MISAWAPIWWRRISSGDSRPRPWSRGRRAGRPWEALRKIFEIYENFRVEAEEYIDAGDKVIVVGRARATARRLGIDLDQQWASVWTVRDGRLIRDAVHAERREALEAAGLRK